MENLNAAKIIEECKMSGEEVVNIVAAHGEDQFIHVVDIEEFAENHDRMAGEIAELKIINGGIKSKSLHRKMHIELLNDETAQLREMLQHVMKCAAMQDNELIDAEEIKKLLNK